MNFGWTFGTRETGIFPFCVSQVAFQAEIYTIDEVAKTIISILFVPRLYMIYNRHVYNTEDALSLWITRKNSELSECIFGQGRKGIYTANYMQLRGHRLQFLVMYSFQDIFSKICQKCEVVDFRIYAQNKNLIAHEIYTEVHWNLSKSFL